MNASRAVSTHTTAGLIYDAIYIAGIGGGTVALFFLGYDVLVDRNAFFTPSLMGSVLFARLSPASVTSVDMMAVAKFTLVHFAVFSVLGLALAWLTHQAEIRSRHPALVIGVVFATLEIGFWIGASLLFPGVLERIGVGAVAAANLLAAVAIGLFLVTTHRPGLLGAFRRESRFGQGPRE
jgi:hypothetical protein